MKVSLRKLMFAGMAAVMTLGASAQTLETVWKHTTGIPGSSWGGEMRFCAALDGKILVNDKTAGAERILYYDETNQNATYLDLKDVCSTWGIVVEGSVTPLGTAISVDDAGNILVNKSFSAKGSSTDWMIIPADGSANVDLTLTLPSGDGARFDQASNIVGNLLSEEGAYIWICKSGATVVDIVKIVNGVQDADKSMMSAEIGIASTTSTVVHPIPTLTVADIDAMAEDEGDLTKTFVMHNRSNAANIYVWGDDTSVGMTPIAKSGSGDGFSLNKASNEGFQTFALQGKVYYVAHLNTNGTDAGRCTMFGVFDETGALVAHSPIADNIVTGGATINGFAVEPCDENSVFIYNWYPSKIAAKFKFSVPAATPAAPVLVTTNPENGAKVTSLEGIVLEFDQNVTVDTSMGNEAVWVMNADSEQMVAQGQLLPGQLAMTQARAILDTPVTNAGNYKVIITSGLISGADGGKNAEIVLNYTIESQGGDEWVFTPASGSTVTSLSSITLDNTSTSFMVSWSGTAQLTDAEGNVVATVTDPENYFESETAMESFRAILPLDTEITTPGTYTLTVPAGYFLVGSDWQSMQNSPELTATYTIEAPAAPLYAVGPWQNWDAANPSEFEYANGLYTLTMGTTEAPVNEFKMSTTKNSAEAPGDWNNGFNIGVICVANDQLVTAGQEFPLYVGGNANITFASADVWVVTVDLVNKTISAESGAVAGIEDVEVEAAEAVYYNLQGVQVAADALTPGMYVKVAGKTATKVVVK